MPPKRKHNACLSPERPAKRLITSYFPSAATHPDPTCPTAPSPISLVGAQGPDSAGPSAPSGSPTASDSGLRSSCSISLRELRQVTRQMAQSSVDAMRTGYSSRSKQTVPPAEVTDLGCWLAAKGANRLENGYVAVAPEGLTATLNLAQSRTDSKKCKPQGIHRLTVIASKPEECINRLLYEGWHASHLCHIPTCFNPDHIAVEAKASNEARKSCKGKTIWRVRTGSTVWICPPAPCPHRPRCLFPTEEREPTDRFTDG